MIEKITPQELIISKLFTGNLSLREPVWNIVEKIYEGTPRKIILTGGRGVGKSTVLASLTKPPYTYNTKTINLSFDSVIHFSESPNNLFTEDFFHHYYELVISWQLLNYAKNYYTCYPNYAKQEFLRMFKDIEEKLTRILNKTNEYLRHAYYSKIKLDEYLTPQELSPEILNRLKDFLDSENINITIDRFDWINGRSELSQQVLSTYFDMFNKVILTSDDQELATKERQTKLQSQGYTIIPVNYGSDYHTIRSIIETRLKNIPDLKLNFHPGALTNQKLLEIINKAEGNITIILNIISELTDIYQFDSSPFALGNLRDQIDLVTDKHLNHAKILTKSMKEPKLYL